VGNCFPTEGDFAILELVEVKRRYPLVRINAVPYLVEAVHRYFKEAEERGCAVDEELKCYVAERIRSLLEKHGIDLSTMSTYDLHGVNKDVLDVLKILGLEPAPPPRPTATPYFPASHKPRTPARSPPSPSPPQSAKPIPPPPMPPRGYKPTRRRRRIKSALAKAAVKTFALLTALAVALYVVVVWAGVGGPSHPTVIEGTPLPPTFANTLDDPAVRAAFETLNRYRVENGVPPVEFIQLNTSLFRAKYLFNHSHLSHYDIEGRHPIYYYTLLDGGTYAAEENLGETPCAGMCIKNATHEATIYIYNMIYNDALSFWGIGTLSLTLVTTGCL